MAPFCHVMGFVMLAVLLGACHAGVTLPSSSTTTTTTTTTTSSVESDVVNVSEKETVVASTDTPTSVSNATGLPPVEDKGVSDNKQPSTPPSPSTVGDKEKEGEEKDDKEGKDKEDREETDKEKKEKGEPLEVDDMLKDPYRNVTVEESTAHADKDTVTVVDSHVVDSKKTHEEEAAYNDTTTSPPSLTKVTDEPVSQVLYSESTIATPVMALVVDHSNHDHLSPGKTSPFTQTTATAAILAGVLVGLAVTGYVGLVMWRKILEKRYGNREMLVNEDDDMHHFEL